MTATLAPSPIRLYDYQGAMVKETYHYIRSGCQRILLVVIMGAGKTYTSAWMIRDAVSRGHRCVFLVTLNVLLDQTAKSLRSLGVDCTILQGDRVVDKKAPVVVASLQTIAARLKRGKTLEELLGCPKQAVCGR